MPGYVVPESPRRGSTTGGNPLKSDLELINLMEQLEVVNSYDSFQRWKETFLSRFESFLGDDGSSHTPEKLDFTLGSFPFHRQNLRHDGKGNTHVGI